MYARDNAMQMIQEKLSFNDKIGCYLTKKLRFLGQNGKKTCSKGKKNDPHV